jgi:hypothetical protein
MPQERFSTTSVVVVAHLLPATDEADLVGKRPDSRQDSTEISSNG